MTKGQPTISSMLHELSSQHACDGHIDIALADALAAAVLQSDDAIDFKWLRHVIILQSHVIADMDSDCSTARLREVSALQAVIRALIGR